MASDKKSYKTTAIDELTSAFDLLDLEGNGDLEFVEFKIGLQSLRVDLTHEEAIQLFDSIDADKAGVIDRESFLVWLKKDINSAQIEDIRTRLRAAISKQTNATAVDDDDELEKEMKRIARRQSQIRPELAMGNFSQVTVIEHSDDSDDSGNDRDSDDSDYGDSDHRSSRRNKRDKHKRSKSRNKRKHKRSATGKYRKKSEKKLKVHKKHGTDIPTSGYRSHKSHKSLKSPRSRRKHEKHGTGISTASYTTTIIREGDNESSDDDSSLLNPNRKNSNSNNNTDGNGNGILPSDLLQNVDPKDADPAMLKRLEYLRNQEMRRVTREVELRHVISETNANKFSRDDIKDMASEMLLEMDRLRRDSLTNKDETATKETLQSMNKHVREFSDSLDAKTFGNIQKDIDADISGMDKTSQDISNDYQLVNTENNKGNGDDSKPDANASGNVGATTTKNDDEFDATLIDTIEASLGSKKDPLQLGLLQYSNQSNPDFGTSGMNGKMEANTSEENNSDLINKKASLTLDNQDLDLEQTGNIDENALDNDRGNNSVPNSGNANDKAGSSDHQTPGNADDGVLRSDTVKGRAGSMSKQFQDRSSFENGNGVSHGLNPPATGVDGLNLERINSTDVLGLRGLPDDDISMMKTLTKKYDPMPHVFSPQGQDTFHSLPPDVNMTTRATSHSYDRMMSDHTTMRSHHYPTQSMPPILANGGNAASVRPMISGSFGVAVGMGSLPNLPSGHGMLHNTAAQPVLITNTQHSYQPPIPTGNTIHTSMNNHIGGSNAADRSRNNSYSKRSDSHHSISLSHHGSLHSQHSMNSQNNAHPSNIRGSSVGADAAYTMDITQFNGSNSTGLNDGNESLMGRTNTDAKHWVFRFINWYLEPIHSKATFKRLLYHGANLAFASICCSVTVVLFFASLPTLITCCVGLLGFWALFEASRWFAQFDMQLGYYFFDTSAIPRFSIYIPMSHGGNITTRLRDYFTDPHMLQILIYLMVFKLPSAIALSGVSLVLFSGVASVLLSPLVFWFEPDYFNDGYFCVFGSKTYQENNVLCTGWSVDSFGDTILAFLLFLPLMPLTLHLCKYTAKLLFRITCHFMTMDVKYRKKMQDIQLQYEAIDLEPL